MLKRLTTKVYLIHLGFFNRHVSFFVYVNVHCFLLQSNILLAGGHHSADRNLVTSPGREAPMLENNPFKIVSSFSRESTRSCRRLFSAESISTRPSVSCCLWRALFPGLFRSGVLRRVFLTEMLFSSRFFLYSSELGSAL